MKRIIGLTLLLSLIFGTVGCDSQNDVSFSDGTVANTNDDALPAGIEKCDYGNAEFHIAAPNWGLYTNYFFSDGEQSDAMDKAIYERELKVEEHLGIDITYEFTGDINSVRPAVQQMVMSGDDTYQLVLTHCIAGVSAMVTEELLYDFNELPGIDLSAEWWNQSITESLTVNGHNYYAVSDYMIPDPNCVLFNKEFIEIYDLEDPYELVRNKEWTLDKMMEMMSKVTKDNGNGTFGKEDTWGLANPTDWLLVSFTYSSGGKLCSLNDDGEFELSFGDERTYAIMDKIHALVNGNDSYNFNSTDYNPNLEDRLWISDGRSLFAISSVNWLSALRETEVDYGILPYPLFDETQESYTNNDWSGLMCVPTTVGDPDMVSKAIELLSYYSSDTTIPAYYDIVLGAKLSRDDDSVEMLDIIFDGTVFDAGMNYFAFSPNTNYLFYTPYYHIAKEGRNDFSSWLAKYTPGAESEIALFNASVNK